MCWKKSWLNIKESVFNIIKAINHAWKKIVFTLVGNFFPIYFGGGILYFLKEDFNITEILKPDTYIVYAAGFIVTSIFLWYANQTRKSYITLIAFFLFFMSISGLFILSYLENIHNKAIFMCLCKYAFILSLLVYIFQEIKNSFYEVNADIQEQRTEEFNDLKNKFRPKK